MQISDKELQEYIEYAKIGTVVGSFANKLIVHMASTIEGLKEEVERLKGAISRINMVNGSMYAYDEIERIITEVSP